MGYINNKRKTLALLTAVATLAGGLTAGTAYAGGGGGNRPGTGGSGAATQFWQYKDDASGAWGPATSLDSVRAAMNNAGVTLEGNGITKAQAALDQARTECETGFQRRHPGEGNGDCRVVAVGAVPAVFGGNYIYNGSGVASPTGTGGWYDNWNKYVAPNTYKYAGTQNYHTSDGFSDDPSNSVDAIMRRNVEASSKPSIVVIVLDKYQPAPPSYHLSVSTQAAEMSGQSGDTKDASDTITLSSDGSKTENVNGTATLHWRGIDGTEKTVAKQFTASNKGSATVSASFKDMDASWESWPAGKRWWDVDVAKQGNMAEAVSHKGENDGKESGEKTTTPPEKWLTNGAGDTVRDGNDSIASGSLYTAHIKAHSNASGKFWIYDTIDTRDVVIGGTEQDDVSKVTVTDANGNIVPADISIDDSIDGKRVVKAHATAPHSGLYTLNVPQSAKPTGGDYEINDGSVACWNGDNGTGSLADCQTGNSDSVGKVTPTPDKVWVLDESGALVAEDKQWTNQQGVDQKTFLVGDQVGVVVNGSIPAHLLNPLASYSITDDLTGSNQWIDWKSGKVFVDGKDETANFTIAIDRKAGTATATAKSAYIAKTMFKNSASKVKFYLTGTIKKGATEGKKIQLTNKAYEKWNNETRPTNEPPVFVWTPNPNKAWAMKADGKWQLTVDPTKTDKVGGDDKYYRLGDEVAAVISGTLPTGLGRVPEIAWTDDFANVDSILDLKDTSNIKVYEQDTTDEANASVNDLNKTGKDVTARFNIQDKDGVLYAFAKTVDTQIPATGETVPGDPQPDDLKAYSEKSDKDYDPLKDPSIDQSLLGHTYQVVMPMTVTKVKDGHTVENTATQVTNDKRDKTNTVTNPLKEINPTKDVTVKVGGDSIDGKSVYLNHTFLYRLDSSILPPDRAYQTVTDWGGTDRLNTEYDQYLGNWAVYASRDLYRDGQMLAAKGEKIAGSGFDSSKFGGNLFTVDADDNGKVTADATQAYLDLVSADNEHEAGWVLYLQCKRIAVADEVPNTWTETINGQPRESNKVVTKTPDMTPSIHLEKVDTPTLKQDGQEQADRDDSKQALKMDADSIGITFIITNTSKTDPATGDGAWFKASDLDLDDSTIVGDAHVDMDSLTYPADWDTLVLKPGESVSVTGTLKGVKEGDTHTDRAIVTGTPLVECAPSNGDPFNDKTDGGEDTDPEYSTGDVTEIDGKQLCADTQTASNTDDWNGYRAKPLASTGVAVLGLAGGALAVLLAGGSLLVFRKRHYAQGSGRHTAVNAGK